MEVLAHGLVCLAFKHFMFCSTMNAEEKKYIVINKIASFFVKEFKRLMLNGALLHCRERGG